MAVIKICGLTRDIDMEYVNQLFPDYIGFVFAKSKRQINDTTAFQLKQKLDPKIKAVGVFVNDSIKHIQSLCNTGTIDLIQLHGNEDETYIRRLKETISNPILRAIRVRKQEDIQNAEKLSCDYLLLDAYHENQYGGSGKSFDWTIIENVQKPFFLAGGINPSNVRNAISQVQPYGIDVSSGVETDGVKDPNKLLEIITKVRSVK